VELKEYLKTNAARIEKRLGELVATDCSALHSTLFEAARYSLLGHGKRLRPMLALATTEMLGGDLNAALSPACTLEMVHTYSLIHDDLPSMDDDDFRRGKESLHKAYDEATAILTGDYLITYAFEVIATAPGLTAEQRLALITTLSQRSGGDGMIAGQIADMASEDKVSSLEVLKQIHYNKTSALIAASIEFGAIVADVSRDVSAKLREFGYIIGLAFQIVDDILDVTSTTETLGKPAQSDIENKKSTYVSLLGLEDARRRATELITTASELLEEIPYDTSRLAAISEMILNRAS